MVLREQRGVPLAKGQQLPTLQEEVEGGDYGGDTTYGRLPSSSRRYYMPDLQDQRVRYEMQPGVVQTPRVRAGRNAPTTTAAPPASAKKVRLYRRFPLVAIILGMALMALLAFTISSIGSWWTMHQQDVTYGRPRTFQIDAVVGHNDSPANPSHFIFLNLNRHVIIIEIPGGDTSKARIYNGPTLFGDGQELTPVTGSFQNVCGGSLPDMVLLIQDQTTIYSNDGTQLVPATPKDNCSLPTQGG